jgi:hypothetical protein
VLETNFLTGGRAGILQCYRMVGAAVALSPPCLHGLPDATAFCKARYSCPVGTVDSSPAVHCWEAEGQSFLVARPVGTVETGVARSTVPTGRRGHRFTSPRHPAMNRWAIVERPYGSNCLQFPLSRFDASASGVAGPHGTVYDLLWVQGRL